MQTYLLEEISEIVGGKIIADNSSSIEHVYFDSRHISSVKNALFIALKNSRDGHYFIQDAFNKGIKNFIVSDKSFLPESSNAVLVTDTLQALQKWAAYHREKYTHTVVGLTGSNGKTIVKEWIYQILYKDIAISRSPKSYNSQLGIALSLLQVEQQHDLAIIECGISKPKEMLSVQRMVKPTIGILTNVGPAHSAFFESRQEHIKEKLSLFKDSEIIILSSDDSEVLKHAESLHVPLFTYGYLKSDNIQLLKVESTLNSTQVEFNYQNQKHHLEIPFSDKASIQNALLCLCYCLYDGFFTEDVLPKFKHLSRLDMRLEILEGIGNSIIINDGFTIDLSSISIALNQIIKQNRAIKTLFITDILQSRQAPNELYKDLAELVNSYAIDEAILIGETLPQYKSLFDKAVYTFRTTDEVIQQLPKSFYSDKAILLKGARKFQLELLANHIAKKSHQTQMLVDLENLAENFNYYRSLLNPDTKIMAMVKAFGYGSGASKIAQTLQEYQVDYLGVAYADEGAELRQNNIYTPIMVMNANQNSFQTIVDFDLEPEIYSITMLSDFISFLIEKGINKAWKVHIKFNTGMNRLGFNADSIAVLKEKLADTKTIEVVSVFSHLSSADDPKEEAFTRNQVRMFNKMYSQLTTDWQVKPLRHILNSSGIVNFPDSQMDMVRLGLGMFGITDNQNHQKYLKSVLKFESVITQIDSIKAGDSVGYNRAFIANKPMKIAVVPVGYADGLRRTLSNGKGALYVHKHAVPIVGNVCMDMVMVDVTDLKVLEGEQVEIFGDLQDVKDFAKQCETIPYEVLTSISSRVKRIYVES